MNFNSAKIALWISSISYPAGRPVMLASAAAATSRIKIINWTDAQVRLAFVEDNSPSGQGAVVSFC
jgi:hypothetical protein